MLTYYFVANLAAFSQQPAHRRYPRWAQVLGMVLCALLVATLPWQSLLGGAAMFGAGFLVRGVAELRRTSRDTVGSG